MEARQPRPASAAVIRLLTTMDGIDPALAQAVANGTYVVDPAAVADAILRRHSDVADARRLSEVLVAAERDERAAGIAQRHPGAGADVA
jgi:hypothetical protein